MQKGVDKVKRILLKPIVIVFGLMILAVFTPQLKADNLGPGGGASGPGDAVHTTGDFADATVLADTGVLSFSVTNGLNQTVDTGSYQVIALSDPENTFCAGCVDILAQIYVASGSGDIYTISLGNFKGFQTDVAYEPGYWLTELALATGFNTETLATSVARSSDGSTVNYIYDPIPVGNDSELMVVETDGTSYAPGTIQLIDNGTFNGSGYGPAVPEPMTASLLGFGLLSLLGLRKKLFA